ncbi:MAG: acetate--CoA ligase family protein [Candidatus Gracilibacteria bacterium]|nr:acetate--CoA ligase family protein [Candidatus Gracilibacteria bacterium]
MKNNFFDINSVAIIGASEAAGKIGNDLLKNLKNFKGKKMGVNPKGGHFDDITFYESIDKLPFVPDVAVITIPAKLVLDSLEQCGQKGIKRVIIISAGFKEVGNIEDEEKIKEIAKIYNIRVLGPNCLGYIDAYKSLNLSFGGKEIMTGNIAMISQSGAMAVALTDWAITKKLGFSKIISMGNKSDLNENDLLADLENDDKTEVIVVYLESLECGRSFYEISRKLTKKKPIILVKSGLSSRGQVAASSHTGALSSENKVIETAFRDAGIHTTTALEDFFLWAQAFSKNIGKDIPDSLAIITNAGGPGVMATDHCEYNNVEMKNFSETEQAILKVNMPDASSMKNPIDIIGDANSMRYKNILENITKLDEKVGILVLLTPQTSTDVDNIAKELIDFEVKNPEYFMMASFMGFKSVIDSRRYLRENDVIEYDYPKKGIRAFGDLVKQKKWQLIPIQDEVIIHNISEDKKLEIISDIKKQEKLCNYELVSKILKAYDVAFLEDKLATSVEDVEKIFDEAKNKLVAKIASKDIAHKTDCGGVVVGLATKKDAIDAYEGILKSVASFHPDAQIDGVTFQEMLPKSKEIFIGMKRDTSFGDLLIIGMGGIFVNIYEDVYMKLSPVNKTEIRDMFTHLKGYPILNGARGDTPINFDSLVDIIFKVMSIFSTFNDIKEIDINPVFSNEHDSIIVDAKFYL